MTIDTLDSKATTHIRPASGWAALDLIELWNYRDLLQYLTLRDIKARYRQTALGWLWIVLGPLGSMVLFTFIFGTIARMPSDNLPYPLFAYSGLLPWGYFSGALGAATGSLSGYMGIISKVYFPRLITPLVPIVSGLVDFSISLAILIALQLAFGYVPTANVIWLPFFILLAALTALSIGLWNAALVVMYRDWGSIVGYSLQVWLYITPVVYASKAIPPQFQLIYKLNPMYWVVEGFRWALLGTGASPEPLMLIPIGIVLVLLLSGLFVFRRTESNVVDWL